MREIKQSWWHIQDQLNPSKGRLFRQVMDLHTDENSFEIPLNKLNFVKLKVRNRNNGNELSYLECNGKIIVNLGNLNEWPKAKGHTDYRIKHVKLEVEYTLLNPRINLSLKRLLNPTKRIKYTGAFVIKELIQAEFYITMPRGLRLKSKGQNSHMVLGVVFNNKDLKRKLDKSNLKKIYSDDKRLISAYEIKYDVYIDKDDKKESYSYLVNNEEYKILKKHNKELKDRKVFFGFYYEASYDRKLLGILVGIELFIALLISFRIYYLTIKGGDGSFTLPFIVVLISYLALLLKYHDEEYNLPLIGMILIIAIIAIVWATAEMALVIPPTNTTISNATFFIFK